MAVGRYPAARTAAPARPKPPVPSHTGAGTEPCWVLGICPAARCQGSPISPRVLWGPFRLSGPGATRAAAEPAPRCHHGDAGGSARPPGNAESGKAALLQSC